jgi:sarcosine oxidase subunit gamma
MQALNISNVSSLARFGVKGPQAEKWLVNHGVVVPQNTNCWQQNAQTLVMRLGASEFLIEDQFTHGQADGKTCEKLTADTKRVAGVYKIPSLQASWILDGRAAPNLLSEVCSLDLSESALPENAVLMTQVAGISATVLRQKINNEAVYRLWCDGTYGVYMQHMLSVIAEELVTKSG